MSFDFLASNSETDGSFSPLTVEEVIDCMTLRWGVTYDLRLLVKGKRIYLQVMWRYLEQQSFPLTEQEFKNHLNQLLEIINRMGQSELVRIWLRTVESRPRLGRAITLPLEMDQRMEEFILSSFQ